MEGGGGRKGKFLLPFGDAPLNLSRKNEQDIGGGRCMGVFNNFQQIGVAI